MSDQRKTKAVLMEELEAVRVRVSELEKMVSDHAPAAGNMIMLDDVPVSLSREDYTDVLSYLEELNFREIDDFGAFLREHPEVTAACVKRVKVLEVNQSTVDLHRGENAQELCKSLETVFTEDSYRGFEFVLVAIHQGRYTCEFATVVKTLDGMPIPALVKWFVPPQARKNLSSVIVSLTDLTEAKRQEETFLAGERSLAEAQAITHVGSWSHHIGTDTLFWSDELFRIMGIERQDMTLELFMDCIHPDDRKAVKDAIQRGEEGEPSVKMEFRVVRPDGTVAHVLNCRESERDSAGKEVRVFGTTQDITERKLAEKELRESEERFRTLFDEVPISLWEEDFSNVLTYLEELKFREIENFEEYLSQHPEVTAECLRRVLVVAVNKASVDLSGAATAEQLLEGFGQTLMPQSFKAFEQELLAIWRSDIRHVMETQVKTIDSGRPLEVIVNWLVTPGREDTLSRVLVSITDITQHKRAQILESDQREILELIAGGRASQADVLEAITRVAEKHVMDVRASILLFDGHSIRHGAAPNMPEAYNELLDGLAIGPAVGSCGTAMYRKERVIVEDVSTDPLWADYRDLGEDYGFRACWSQPFLDPDGVVLGTFALYRKEPGGPDTAETSLIEAMANLAGITIQRTQRETELRKLSTAIEQSPSLVMITDLDGTIEYVNRKYCDVTGYTKDEFLGKNPRILRSEVKSKSNYREHMEAVLSGGGWRGEFHNKKKNGELYWETGTISCIKDESGEISHLLSVMEDTTERKALEATNRELERHVRRTQKLETIGTLAGGIAHDFNNILTPIMGHAEIALEQSQPSDPLYEGLERILDAAQRAKHLVDRILLFSSQTEKERKPVKIQSIAHEAIQLLRSSIPATIVIDEQIDSSCGLVLADETQIHEIIINICTNAYQSMAGSSGTLTLRVARAEIDADETSLSPKLREPEYVLMSIRDTGTGMDSETLDRIFEPFFTTKTVDRGTGMGLAVVHGIVQSHNGDILVRSTPGEGTVFEVYLPVTMEVAQTLPGDSKELEKGQESILVLDDDPAVAEVVSAMVKRLGYEVSTYTDSPAALEELKRYPERYDLLVSDMTMPGLTGLDMSGRLRHLNPPIPILIMTGYGEKLVQEGNDIPKIIAKPVAMKELGGAIRELLDN